MVVIGVLYPNSPTMRFDLAYYRDKHLPLVRRVVGPKGLRSLSFVEPVKTNPDAPFRVIAELRFDSLESANAALTNHGADLMGDIPNFTDAQPHIVVGEETQA